MPCKARASLAWKNWPPVMRATLLSGWFAAAVGVTMSGPMRMV